MKTQLNSALTPIHSSVITSAGRGRLSAENRFRITPISSMKGSAGSNAVTYSAAVADSFSG